MPKYVIEVDKEIKNIKDWIKEYFVNNGPDAKAVLGMSGGKDSTITAKLLCEALGPERVYGVIMPEGEMKDQELAEDICRVLGINYSIINIKPAIDALYGSLSEATLNTSNPQIYTNTPARIRMTTLYAVAAEVGGRVVNTCNRSEDYVGFATKYGDLAGDFSVLQNYYVRWVREIGYALGLPYSWVNKTPDDGMCGQSDEDKFGFTYDVLDDYLIDDIIPEYDIYKKIEEMHNCNKHKDVIRLLRPSVKTKHLADKEYTEEDD